MEPPFFTGAGADPIWPEPESAPGPRTSGAGAAQNSGRCATLVTFFWTIKNTSYKIYISDIIIPFLGTGTRFSFSFN